MTTIKAITIRQPWATLMAIGAKHVETRSWPTKHRGPLAIHASARMTREDRAFAADPRVVDALIRYGHGIQLVSHPKADGTGVHLGPDATVDYPTGEVLAIVNLYDCRPTDSPKHQPPTTQERAFGDWTPGRYAWATCLPDRLPTPAPATGRLGLWDWTLPDDIASTLRFPWGDR